VLEHLGHEGHVVDRVAVERREDLGGRLDFDHVTGAEGAALGGVDGVH
jgi:hypothetical protein